MNLFIIEISSDEPKLDKLYNSLFMDVELIIIMFDLTDSSCMDIIDDILKKINSCNVNSTKIFLGNKLDEVNGSSILLNSSFSKNKKSNIFEISLQTKANYINFFQLFNKTLNLNQNANKTLSLPLIQELDKYDKTIAMSANDNYKILLVGDSTVGKSCFFTQYFKDQFIENNISTLGFEKENKIFKIDSEIITCQIWDTAGQDRFRSSIKEYYQKTDGIILMYDVTQSKTFDNVLNWIKTINENVKKRVVVYLVANKIDMIDELDVSNNDAKEVSMSNGLKFFQVSAKYNINVNDVVKHILLDIYNLNRDKEHIIKLDKGQSRCNSSCSKGN
jgi:small GTP-binding protein